MSASHRDEFVEFLQERLHLEETEIPQAGEWSNVGNTVGALSLRLNLLTVDQIDRILEVQESDSRGKRFGELAVELEFLTQPQADRLLQIQKLNKRLERGEELVLSGKVEMESLVELLHEFTQQTVVETVS